MRSGNNESRTGARRYAAPALATLLAACAVPPSAAEEFVLEMRDAGNVVDSAASYYYQKTLQRKITEAACYFDPKVENSMRCSWSAGSQGSDPYRMQQEIKRRLTKWCKKAGGRKCVPFWRNGRIRFDGLSSEQMERLQSVLDKIFDYDAEASSLPEGVGVSDRFREWFPKARDHFDGLRKKRRGHNPHFAICTNKIGPSASFYMQGGGVHISNVRNVCVLKCNALTELFSKNGECYVVYENGKFASAAAEASMKQ